MNVDVHLHGSWMACATVDLVDPDARTPEASIALRYETGHALEHLMACDLRALSVRWPVNLGVHRLPRWPSFLEDLLPQGAGRERRLRGSEVPASDWDLLQGGAANPVGNLRIRPLEPRPSRYHPGFGLRDVINAGAAFIDHATRDGAAVAGATDVRGNAPKCWVVETGDGLWLPDDGRLGGVAQRYAMLKFSTPQAGPAAEDLLRHEAAYQRVAQRLGLGVTQPLPQHLDGLLLIPRFDRRRGPSGEIRLGVESLSAVVQPGGTARVDRERPRISHDGALLALQDCLTDFSAGLIEYVRRDIVNLALGHRDNHGRNSAILKEPDGTVRLAPVFGIGPSFLDARAPERRARWDGEIHGSLDWSLILDGLAGAFDSANRPLATAALAEDMRSFAAAIAALPELMRDCGVDDALVDLRRGPIARLSRALEAVRAP